MAMSPRRTGVDVIRPVIGAGIERKLQPDRIVRGTGAIHVPALQPPEEERRIADTYARHLLKRGVL
jgi:hypothetical protein